MRGLGAWTQTRVTCLPTEQLLKPPPPQTCLMHHEPVGTTDIALEFAFLGPIKCEATAEAGPGQRRPGTKPTHSLSADSTPRFRPPAGPRSSARPPTRPRVCAYLFHEHDQRFPIILPLLGQLALVRVLVAAHVDGQLEAVGVKVAEIVETCQANRET